jgi:RNA polymerase sigma-70 factor (subfamily 1)
MSGISRERFEALLTAARDGSKEAIGELLILFQRDLHCQAAVRLFRSLGPREEAFDAIQTTYLHALARFAEFTGSSRAEFQRWLQTILVNVLTDFHRAHTAARRDVRREVPLNLNCPPDEAVHFFSGELSPMELLIGRETNAAIHGACASLEKDDQDVVRMHCHEMRTLEEVGSVLGLSADAVRKRFGRILQKLRNGMTTREVGAG